MRRIIFAIFCSLLITPSLAGTITINPDGTGDYPTIQAAIDDANDGDVIILNPGTYIGHGNRDIDFKGKAITVRSENGPESIAATIIDCNGTPAEPHRGFYFHSQEKDTSQLKGLTISNGNAPQEILEDFQDPIAIGGAIFCAGSNPKIISCRLMNNKAEYGAAVSCYNCSPIIEYCRMIENTSRFGGGIYCYKSDPTVANSSFKSNQASYGGGGIYCRNSSPKIIKCIFSNNYGKSGGAIRNFDYSNPLIYNCIFNNNTAGFFGGAIGDYYYYYIEKYLSEPTIINCLFNNNKASSGGAILGSPKIIVNSVFSGNASKYEGGAMLVKSLNLINCTLTGNRAGTIAAVYSDFGGSSQNCILYNNEPEQISYYKAMPELTYSNVEGGWPGDGNINADPCFVLPGYWDPNGTPANTGDDFYVSGDYHLLPSSPCINTGDPCYPYDPNETDLDGNPRIIDDRIDMGAYEYNPPIEVEMKFTPPALNCKSKGNFIKAHITLPEEIWPEDIDVNTPATLEPAGLESEYIKILGGDDEELVQLQIAFGRKDFCEYLNDGELIEFIEDDYLEVTVTGRLNTGRYFYATDTIKILNKN